MKKQTVHNLAAVGAGLLLFLLLEVFLDIAGIRPLAQEDPFVGFEGSLPLFVQEKTAERPGDYILNPAKDRYFNPQSFRMPKPENTVRIISFGGSTTYGRPYLDDTSFPTWTAGILQRCDRDHHYESINTGGISYASYRLSRLMDEMSRFSPDLYVVYSGHNEFLENRTFENIIAEKAFQKRIRSILHHSRTYSALYRGIRKIAPSSSAPGKTVVGEEVDALIEEVGGPELYHFDPVFHQGVTSQYRYNIEAMARLCRRKKIPLLLCTLPSNLSGVSPFKSEHRPALTPPELKAWEEAFNNGQAALKINLYEQALSYFEKAETIDGQFALLHFLKGKSLAGLARHGEAYAAFNQAKEKDIVPLRALDAFNDIIRDTARRANVPLADAEKLFRNLSPNGIPGPALFIDHVHPTIEGQQIIARLVADTAVKAGLVPVTDRMWSANQSGIQSYLSDGLSRISRRYKAMGYWGVGRLFFWAGKYPEAYDTLQLAWKEIKDVPDLSLKLGELEMLRGNPAEAVKYLNHAYKLDPGNPAILFSLANGYLMMEKGEEALALLNGLGDVKGDNPPYHLAMAEAFRLTGKRAESVGELTLAAELAPRVPGIRQALAGAYLRLGDREKAVAEYGEYLQLSKHPDPEGALADWIKTLSPPISP